MTYRDIVLKLLKNRSDLVCVEQHLISDFLDKGNTGENFSKWCQLHGLEVEKIRHEDPPKIVLKKKINFENN